MLCKLVLVEIAGDTISTNKDNIHTTDSLLHNFAICGENKSIVTFKHLEFLKRETTDTTMASERGCNREIASHNVQYVSCSSACLVS